MSDVEWPLDELVAQVAAQLDDGGSTQQPDGRIRPVPDRRAIRWYTTIGLLDRPVLRGRTGWYGRRHLLQLVAVKRLQAAGRSLIQIQDELSGATDATLRKIARLSPAAPVEAVAEPDIPAAATQRPAAVRTDNPATAGTAPPVRFWATPVAASPDPDPAPADEAGPTAGQDRAAPSAGSAVPPDGVNLRCAVELGGGVTLLVTGVPDEPDLAAVRAAARPLLEELARRGLADAYHDREAR